jgi:hypothetical protein
MARKDLENYLNGVKGKLTDTEVEVNVPGRGNVKMTSKEHEMFFDLAPQARVWLLSQGGIAQNVARSAYPDGFVAPPRDANGNPKLDQKYLNDNDGHRDAYRHAMATILVAGGWPENAGGREAGFAYMQARELGRSNNPLAAAMDLHNNAIGYRILKENPDANSNLLSHLVKKSIERGEMLVITKDGNLAWSNEVKLHEHGSSSHPIKRKAMGDGEMPFADLPSDAAASRVASANDRTVSASSLTAGVVDQSGIANRPQLDQLTANLAANAPTPLALSGVADGSRAVADVIGKDGQKLFEHLHGKIGELGIASNSQQLDVLAAELLRDSVAKKLTDTPNLNVVSNGQTLFAYNGGVDNNRAQVNIAQAMGQDFAQSLQQSRELMANNTQPTTQEVKQQSMTV